jgi:peptide/nickel transport system permease protein
LPTFLIGILLILVFAVMLGWFPSFGRGEVVKHRLVDHRVAHRQGLAHITLPAITLAIFQLTLIMRLVRAEMLEVLRTDYIKFARARGLTNRAIHFRPCAEKHAGAGDDHHGLQLGGLIAFAIITETVFQWPGMGLLFIQAVTFADIPVMAAYLCLIALIFVVINLVVDLLYFAVDPRLRVQTRAGGIDAMSTALNQWLALAGQRAGVCPHCRVSPELTALRRDLHAHPELGFEEVYTAASRGES